MENEEETKKRGVTSHDRKLAGEVRRMTLEQIKKILETPKVEMSDKEYELWKSLLLSLSKNILPRLMEVTGEEGEAIKVDNIDTSKMTSKELTDYLMEKFAQQK